MESDLGFPNAIIPPASGNPTESSSSVSDALYSEGSFVDKSTWHSESRVPPINGSSSFGVLDTRTSAFGVETRTYVCDEQILRWISPLSWLCVSDEIILCFEIDYP
jgi:hypothetical protein